MAGFQARQPDFADGQCIACWKAIDINKKEYLKIKIFGGKVINCFKPRPKAETEQPVEAEQ